MTDNNNKIEIMKALAIENGFKIENSKTPEYNFIHAVKGNVKIHIATSSKDQCKINFISNFKDEIYKNSNKMRMFDKIYCIENLETEKALENVPDFRSEEDAIKYARENNISINTTPYTNAISFKRIGTEINFNRK
ncbi:MAG TPA: hypothetical protein VIK72_19295 [Clostridiaceae bacterium]